MIPWAVVILLCLQEYIRKREQAHLPSLRRGRAIVAATFSRNRPWRYRHGLLPSAALRSGLGAGS